MMYFLIQFFGIILLSNAVTSQFVWRGKTCKKAGVDALLPGTCTSYARCGGKVWWQLTCPPGFMVDEELIDCVPGDCEPEPVQLLGEPCDRIGSREVIPWACDAFAICTLVEDSLIWVENKCEFDEGVEVDFEDIYCTTGVLCPPYEWEPAIPGTACNEEFNSQPLEGRCDAYGACHKRHSGRLVYREEYCPPGEKVLKFEGRAGCWPGKCRVRPPNWVFPCEKYYTNINRGLESFQDPWDCSLHWICFYDFFEKEYTASFRKHCRDKNYYKKVKGGGVCLPGCKYDETSLKIRAEEMGNLA